MMKKILGLGLAVLCLAAAQAFAAPMTIGFDDGAGVQNGTVTWGGGLTPLVGAGIDFYTVDGTGTPLNAGLANALTCESCELAFSTGAYSGADGIFGAGGYFTVTGSVFDGLALIAAGTLLDGIFTDDIAAPVFAGLGGSSGLFLGLGTDTKHPSLIDYFGLTSNSFVYASTNISLGTCSSNSCLVTNADIDNLNQVPIVGTWALMPLGLFGIGLARRRAAV